jgi:hypothetical protein
MAFLNGAGDGARTRYLRHGKATLYQMSYSRILCTDIFLRSLGKTSCGLPLSKHFEEILLPGKEFLLRKILFQNELLSHTVIQGCPE